MAEKVKEKYAGPKGKMARMKIETPYPKTDNDVDFIGNELVKLADRINELELSLETINLKLKHVTGRMGL